MINIIKQPLKYTPVGNANIWQVETSNLTLLYFDVSVIEATSEDVIIKQKYYARPDYVNGVSFNLSDVLSSLVEIKVDNDSALSKAVSGATLSYRLIITEKMIDNYLGEFVGDTFVPNPTAGQIIDGSVYDEDDEVFTVWDSKLDRLVFNGYDPLDYTINEIKLAKFLSIKPSKTNQTGTSTEHLYFINAGQLAKTLRIKTYDVYGVFKDTYNIELVEGLLIRLNVSAKNLFSELDIDFSDTGHYSIVLLDEDDAVISESKTYKYINDRCALQPVNFLFTNSLGGVESFTLFNPKETINYSKTYLKTNELQFNDGSYSDNVNGILNQSQKTINVNSTSTYTVFSNPLNDVETTYLRELIGSKNVYVELSDNHTLVPIKITNTNYQLLLRATNGRKLNKLEISYEAQAGFIPSNGVYGSNYGSQVQILNPQLICAWGGFDFEYLEPIEDDLDI